MNFSIDRRANIHSWARTGPPALKNGMKESVFVPLGPLNDDVQRDQYITEFNILYGEHIEGFKKIKKEKGDKERNMEWRQRLKRKQEKNGGSNGGGSSSSSSSSSSSNDSSSSSNNSSKSRKASGRGRQKHKQNEEDRDRLKAIQAYKKLKAERGSKGNLHNRFETNARSKVNSKPPMTMQNSSSMNEFESSIGDNTGRSTASTTGNSGSSGSSESSESSGNNGGGGKKRLSKAERKKLKAQGKR